MTAPALRWTSPPADVEGVTDRGFVVEYGGRSVPGVLWTPSGRSGPRPLVLLGHGGGGHKRDEHRVAMALDYAHRHGFASAAIDWHAHGDRALPEGEPPNYSPAVCDDMAADWRTVLDALTELEEIDGERVAYGGVSLGTILGLPFVASEPRIRAAVLGLAGLFGEFMRNSGLDARLAADAAALRCPTLFIVQWDDELVDREGAFALFGLIGAGDKRMHVHPGLHGEVPLHVADTTTAFLARFLEG